MPRLLSPSGARNWQAQRNLQYTCQAPERFGARPTQDVVRGSYLANECLARALIPGILVPPNVKNNLGVGVCLDKLRGEDRASRVCDRRAAAEDLVELRGSDL